MSTMIAVALAVLAGALFGVTWLWRGAERARQGTSASLEQVTAERETLSTQLARETSARKKQGEELAALRKKNDKARRREARAEKGGAGRAVGTAARLADLEDQLARAERARARGQTEREQLAAEVTRLEAQLAAARQKPAPLPATPPATPPTTPPGLPGSSEMPLAATAAPDDARDDAVAEAVAEAAALREQLAKANEALEQAKLTEARMRKRMSNQEQLYASVRAELDVKKDRLRTQEERIQRLEALQVAMQD